MARLLALLAVVLVVPLLVAADPAPVEKQLTIQNAMLSARQALEANRPGEAVAALEAVIASADGNKAFLTLLREAYTADLVRLEKTPGADGTRVAQLRRHLALLGGTAPEKRIATPTPASTVSLPPPSLDQSPAALPSADSVAEAAAAFKKGEFATAARHFAANSASLTAEQRAAWAYCRVWNANDKLASSTCDAATASALSADVGEALKLAPGNVELQKVGKQVIAKANARLEASDSSTGDSIASASFRVHHSGHRELAESVAKAAESLRQATFERWSGPPAGPWSVKCDIYIHSTAAAYAKTTGRPAASTGNAIVRLNDGRAEERRIDLRADDEGLAANALPRELTHIVLADLFPDRPAPKWAVEGMAILAGAPEEAERFTRHPPPLRSRR